MFCKCPICGERYTRFTVGDYCSEKEHKCKEGKIDKLEQLNNNYGKN